MSTRVFAHQPSDSDEPLLDEHQHAVAAYAKRVTPNDVTAPGGTPIHTLVEIGGLTHDIGKAHPEFQRALFDDDTYAGPEHAPLGAAAAFYTARQRNIPLIDATIVAIAVAKHHQRLPSTQQPTKYIDRFKQRVLGQTSTDKSLTTVISRINEYDEPPDDVVTAIVDASNGNASWGDFVNAIETHAIDTELDGITFRVNDQTEHYYTALLDVWSTVSFADKVHSSDTEYETATPPQNPFSISQLRDHVDALGDEDRNTLDALRQRAFEHVNGNGDGETGRVHEFIDTDTHVATLTLSTGLGKTLTGLTAAHTIKQHTPATNIVYALPYTSIIDQTDTTIQDIFDVTPTDPSYTVDHSMRDTVTVVDEHESVGYTRQQRLLGDIWQADTVLTTFVQLFESVLGPHNRQALKLPNLRNSVIVLDEPQALPDTDWDEIRDALHVLVNTYDAHVVLMTATQPGLLQPDDRFNTFDLVQNPRKYSRQSERVTYTFDASITAETDTVSVSDAVSRVIDDTLQARQDHESALLIGNTIDSTRSLVDELITQFTHNTDVDVCNLNDAYSTYLETTTPLSRTQVDISDWSPHDVLALVDASAKCIDQFKHDMKTRVDGDVIIAHLSTRHRPIDRDVILETVNELLEDEDMPPVIFVSTQLIEAGVDISFPRVYRDFAPLPSIVQAAGRCNREFEQDHGNIVVWQLDTTHDDSSLLPSEAVYARTTNKLTVTRDAIGSRITDDLPATVSDTRVSVDGVETYFDTLRRQQGVMQSPVATSNTGELNTYHLIGDRYHRSVDVVVPRTPFEKHVISWLRDTENTSDVYDVVDALHDRTVSIGVYQNEPTPIEETQPRLLPSESQFTQRVVDAVEPSETAYFDVVDGVSNDESVSEFII